MRKYLLILFSFLITLCLQAQEQLMFNGTEFDFGEVAQIDLPFEHDFIFRNTSFEQVTILAVRSIHPNLKFIHTKSDVFTGEYGFVKVKLYTDSLEGLLNEEIYVTMRIGETVKSQVLYLRANIQATGKTDNERAFNDTKIATSVEVSPDDIETMEGFFGKDRITQVESELKYLRKQVNLKSELIAQLSGDLQNKKATEAENLKQLEELQRTLANPAKVDQSVALAQLNDLTTKLQSIQKADEAMRMAIREQESLYQKAQLEADSARAYAATLSDRLQQQFQAEASAIEKANNLEASLRIKELTEEQQQRQIDSLERLIVQESDDRELQNEIASLREELTWKQNEQKLQKEHSEKQKARIVELKFQNEQIERLTDSLNQNLSARTTENQELQQRLASTNGRISKFEQRIDSLSRLASATVATKSQSKTQLDSLQSELKSMRRADESLKVTIANKDQELNTLLAEKTATQKNLSALEVATTRQVEEAQKLMYRINSLSKRESRAKLEVLDLQTKLQSSRKREDSARIAMLDLIENIEQKNEDLSALQNNLGNKELQLVAMHKEESTLRKSLLDAESKNKSTEAQLDSLASTAELADKKEQLLQKDISRLQAQILASHNQAKESEAHADDLQGRLDNATLSNRLAFEELKAEVEEMRNERDDYRLKYQYKQQELATVKSELELARLSEENAVAFAEEFGFKNQTQTTSQDQVEYAVVILASKAKQPKNASFYGFGKISEKHKQGKYEYSVGGLNNLKSAKELQEKAKAKGYPLAYVIAFKNGIQVSLKEVSETAMR
jgi:chromosome segregation ATPase